MESATNYLINHCASCTASSNSTFGSLVYQGPLKEDKLTELLSRWSAAVQKLLTIMLSKTQSLEVLSVCPNEFNLPIHPAAFHSLATFMRRLSKLKTFCVNLSLDAPDCKRLFLQIGPRS